MKVSNTHAAEGLNVIFSLGCKALAMLGDFSTEIRGHCAIWNSLSISAPSCCQIGVVTFNP
jgi:hypothetical protein